MSSVVEQRKIVQHIVFFCHKQTKTMLCVTILQTLSGEDVPGIDSLDSQISDVDPESKTWNRSRVVMLIWISHKSFDMCENYSVTLENWYIWYNEIILYLNYQ